MTFIDNATSSMGWPMSPTRHRSFRGGVMFRLSLFNLGALAALGAAFGEGWAQAVFSADTTGLTSVITALFAVGLLLSFLRAHRLGAENRAREGLAPSGSWVAEHRAATQARSAPARAIAANALRARVAGSLQPIRQIAGSLVLLGLIGTVLGFIMALSGVSAGMATDAGQVGEMVTRLIEGMSVALYTTLEGSVLSLWLTVNHQILSSAASALVLALVEEGEAHARD
ncbi:Biopolymer transport protein ExbB/TolQ [Meinhardsimonia xiamenensis]|jgi:hypothetical protein|uniref:Biopolymer transport protein ExbB/TolQ n=1 Tax=Meinhardsimonia xiamenensis TaxID=990712 RepID=A0A1G9E8D9_9RHOB|nr:MotA/TolQ/ExbB proton channel family protein [Meinhardsimonia xiamenensis]PRX33883.1 biopolymer transport protein ExbB/TolQ [Meinhardsimonia xiamenensis]SDK72391.1 Biopolymer transport protein ExbB/TolQ [Meinhardsimonia xiamenensis]